MSSPSKTSDIEELQIKIAFQEDTINHLNQIVTQQQFEIEKITQQLNAVIEKLRDITPSENRFAHEEPPPPHY